MHLTKKFYVVLASLLFCILLSACGPSPEELAATDAVETAAASTNTPIPPTVEPLVFNPEAEFPIGRFEDEANIRAFEFDQDGNWHYYEGDLENPLASGLFGTNGNLYTEMTHNYLGERELPATYYWSFNGEELTFTKWGTDNLPFRRNIYNGQTYVLTGPAEILEKEETSNGDTEFPTGVFRQEGSISHRINFLEDGSYKSFTDYGMIYGRYVVNGDFFTLMDHDIQGMPKVPGTYNWEYDGEHLSFRLWGEDGVLWRLQFFDRQTFQGVE